MGEPPQLVQLLGISREFLLSMIVRIVNTIHAAALSQNIKTIPQNAIISQID
jgi:hypothetical protein